MKKKINSNSYKRLASRINNTKNNIINFLDWAGKENVIGYGASTKGNIVLNQCNLSSKNLKLICMLTLINIIDIHLEVTLE